MRTLVSDCSRMEPNILRAALRRVRLGDASRRPVCGLNLADESRGE